MPDSHQVTATIPGHFGWSVCTPKIARYSRGELGIGRALAGALYLELASGVRKLVMYTRVRRCVYTV